MASRSILRQDRSCQHCGKTPITGYVYCSQRCGGIARDRARGVPSWAERYAECNTAERQCVICQASFRRRRKDGDAALCCSRVCGFALVRQRGAASRAVQSEKTVYRRWSRRAKVPKREAVIAVVGKACLACGTVVEKGQQRCGPCRSARTAEVKQSAKLSPAYRRTKRAAKARRRAVERGVEAERFDPFEVFERDGWRCHLCGRATPKRLRGSYDSKAPELDHIIPLAQGGKHTRLNTACACRACNMAKGDKPLGQMRLVA